MADHEHMSIGRKVVFLYPHSVVCADLVQAVAEQQYELYLVRDHVRLKAVLAQPEWRGALLFVNIDEVLGPDEWMQYVRSIREHPATREVHVGVLSYNEDTALAAAYLMDIGVKAGFVRLKLGLAESRRIVLAALEATEARGKRRYVRADCTAIAGATLNVKHGGQGFTGQLRDISTAGFACVFDRDPDIPAEAPLDDIQLKLKGSVVRTSGKVAGFRQINAQRVYVIMFALPHPVQVQERITRFVHDCLQVRMERLLERCEA